MTDRPPTRSAPRQETEEELRRYRSLVENLGDMVARVDGDLRIRYVNRALERALGHTNEALAGEPVGVLVDCGVALEHLERACQWMRTVLATGLPLSQQLESSDDSTECAAVDIRIFPERDAAGQVASVLVSMRDISALREAQRDSVRRERLLRQAQKMDALTRLAGGVARDFNNLLQPILFAIGELDLGLEPDSELRLAVRAVAEATERAQDLTQQLLTFGQRQTKEDRGPVDLHQLIRQAQAILGRLSRREIRCDYRLEAETAPVVGDETQLMQIVMNLAVNAMDAMPDGGDLLLRTSTLPGPPEQVVLEVQDTGIGMDAQTRDHVFDPFFTTKETGKGVGSGLGLSTVHGIVQQHEGKIEIESSPGRGTLVRVMLPTVSDVSVTADGRVSRPRVEPAGATLLLVDDEPFVRSSLAHLLRHKGFEVLVAKDGKDALELCAGRDKPLDLLVTDVVLPGISGLELCDRLRETRSDLPALLMSGHADSALQYQSLDPSNTLFVQKPFRAPELIGQVRRLLGER